MFRPASESAAERLFDVLRQANSSVAWGVWATEKSDDEEGYEPAELERRFSDLYGRLKSELPELTGKSQRIASILEEAADEYDACRRRRDQQACELDSASTRLMRLAGYDGIDVRGLERFDNTIHGSVVYRRKG